MINKDIFGGKTNMENLANQILYQFVAKGHPIAMPANNQTFVDKGYSGNVNIYSIIRKIINPAIGVKWSVIDMQTGEEAKDQTLMMLLNAPNKTQGRNAFIDEALAWRLVTGNRYISWMAPDGGPNAGKPAELHLLPASNVEIIGGGWLEPVRAYHLTIGNTYKEIPADKVIHGKTTNLKYGVSGDQLYGLSPLEAALLVMNATNAGYAGLTKQYENGGPDVIVTGTKETAQKEYTEEQRETVWAHFKSRFMGAKNKGKWLIKNLPVEVHEIGKSPVDLNTLEYLKLSLRDYCNIYGVPSALMNDNEYATQSANAREYGRQLWNNAVIPELEMFKEDMNRIAAQYNMVTGLSLAYEYSLYDIPELQTDYATQSAALSQAWWMSINERRKAMGLEPLEMYGDTLLAPMGLVPISDITDPMPTPTDTNKFYNLTGIKY